MRISDWSSDLCSSDLAGVRTTNDLFLNQLNPFVLDPPQKRLWIGNLFAQDSVSVSDDVTLIGGIKLERTSFTGLQILPNLRLAWKADERALFWAAISRSVRRSEEHTSELQSLMRTSYDVFCLKKHKK